MNSAQKNIKYIAMALGILLATFVIMSAATIISGIFGIAEFLSHRPELTEFSQDFNGIDSLNLECRAGELEIKKSGAFKVEAKNVTKDFKCESEDGVLVIMDRKKFTDMLRLIGDDNSSKITLYLPENFTAKSAEIKAGANNIKIEKLSAEKLKIKMGAGNIEGREISSSETVIYGGVGMLELKDSHLGNLNLNSGVGENTIWGEITGISEIKCGVGETTLYLTSPRDEYSLDVKAGIGDVFIDGKKLSGEVEDNPNAKNRLKIIGGIGEVNINF